MGLALLPICCNLHTARVLALGTTLSTLSTIGQSKVSRAIAKIRISPQYFVRNLGVWQVVQSYLILAIGAKIKLKSEFDETCVAVEIL